MLYLIAALSDDEFLHCKLHRDWFEMNTLNGSVIMGRKTWESLPTKPLENRMNIILTRGLLPTSEGNICWTNSLAEALSTSFLYENTYIVGGSDIFHATLLSGLVDGLIITRVHVNIGRGKSLILPLQKKLLYQSEKLIDYKTSYHYEIYKLKK